MSWRGKLRNRNLLAVLLFFLFLTILFFITAIMDVLRTKSLLLTMAESGGAAVIESLEGVVRERYDTLSRKSGSPLGPVGDFTDIENKFRTKEKAIEWLIDSAKELDEKFKAGPPSNDDLKGLSEAFSVTGIIFLDANGRLLSGSAPLSDAEAAGLKKLAARQHDVYIDVELSSPGSKKTHWIGIKREGEGGRIFLTLDQKNLDLLMLRLIYQEVILEIGRQKGILYLFVTDREGRVIAGSDDATGIAGQNGQTEKTAILAEPGFTGSRRLRRDVPVMDVRLPLGTGMPGEFTGIAGVDITQVQQAAQGNMVHVFVFAGIMICSAGIVLLFIYRIQARYNERVQDLNMQLAQAQRLSSLGKLAAGVAHEIRNPLNAVSMAVQRIFREFSPDMAGNKKEFSRLVSIVRDEIDRLNRIIENFIEPARVKPGRFKPVSLADFLSPVVSLAEETAGPKGIEIVFNASDPCLAVAMDEPRLRQAVWNFLKNAMEAIPGEGRISVTASGGGSGFAEILIADTGTGIGSKALKRVMEFEYTTKDKGLGLGLPMAREIILAHGGDLEIKSAQGSGTTVRILLPLYGKTGLKEGMA